MGDGEPQAFGKKSEAAHRRRRLECAQIFGLYTGDLAGGPGDDTVGAERDMVDPALFRVARQHSACAVDVGRNDSAVVTARDDALAVGCGVEDGAAVDRKAARFALRRRQHDCFFAENEGGGAAEKMHGDNAAADRNRPRAVDHRNCVAAACGHGPNAIWRCSSRSRR